MSARLVFGRRRFFYDGKMYTFELRADGLWVRELRKHKQFNVPFGQILRLCLTQTELFPDKILRKCEHDYNGNGKCCKCGYQNPTLLNHDELETSNPTQPLSEVP